MATRSNDQGVADKSEIRNDEITLVPSDGTEVESLSCLKISRELRTLLTASEKKYLLGLISVLVLLAFLEAMSLSALSAYVSLVADPASLEKLPPIARFFNSAQADSLMLWGGLIVIGIFFAKFSVNLVVIWMQSTSVRNIRSRLGLDLFRVYLAAPWSFHLQNNSSALLRNVNNEVNNVLSGVIQPVIRLVIAAMSTIAVVFVLLVSSDWIGVTPLIPIGIVLWLFLRLTSRRSVRYGNEVLTERKEGIRHIREGLESIPESTVLGLKDYFSDRLESSLKRFTATQRKFAVLSGMTQPLLETAIVIGLVTTIVVMLTVRRSLADIGSVMVLVAAASLRLKTAVLAISTSISQIRYSQPSLELLVGELARNGVEENGRQQPSTLEHWKSIEFDAVSFRHDGARNDCLSRINFKINRGDRIGVIGGSGAGKSTLICLLMGLLSPRSGSVIISGVPLDELVTSWHSRIGYVPQSVYAIDASIRDNILIGVPDKEFDEAQLELAIELSQLKQDVEKMPKGLETHVGERGCRLSGGQRQRLGIARALYRKPDLLILDEVTAGLDIAVENKLVTAFKRLPSDLTIVSIAHRYSAIEMCDTVIEIANGELIAKGTYQEMCIR